MGVYLTDFGLAGWGTGHWPVPTTGRSPRFTRLTRTGEALGTPAYMSPEQTLGAGHDGRSPALSPASDVWALGCVLYEALAGRPAFEGGIAAVVVERVVRQEPPPIEQQAPAVPRDLAALVAACLAKDPRRRPAMAGALRDDLVRVARGERPSARAPTSGRRALLAAVGGLALVAAAAALVASRASTHASGPSASPATDPGAALVQQAWATRTDDPRRAAAVLAAALQAEPDQHDWQVKRGLLLWAIGEDTAAAEGWRHVPDGAPEAGRARLYEGLRAFFGLQGAEAQRLLGGVAPRPGVEGRLARGALQAIDEDWAAARDGLRGLEGWEAALLRGYVEGTDPGGTPEAAVREYGLAIADGIPFAWACTNRGNARSDLGDLVGAIADHSQALAINPRLVQAWVNRGHARSARGDLAEAIADYERALELDPRTAEAWAGRGNTRKALGDIAGAIQDYDDALAIAPGFATVRYNRGNLRRLRGDLAAALEDYDAALAIEPKNAEAWNNRALVRQAQGDRAGAIDDWGKALAIDPNLVQAWTNRGAARHVNGDLEGAIADHQRALEVQPRYAAAWSNRGLARQDQGDLVGSIADLEHALAIAPPGWPHRATVERYLAAAQAALAVRGAGR